MDKPYGTDETWFNMNILNLIDTRCVKNVNVTAIHNGWESPHLRWLSGSVMEECFPSRLG